MSTYRRKAETRSKIDQAKLKLKCSQTARSLETAEESGETNKKARMKTSDDSSWRHRNRKVHNMLEESLL